MVITLIVAVVALLILAVCFAPEIKGWLHGQERAVGAKIKADVDKVSQTTPVL